MKMLQAAVHEIETAAELEKIISENQKIMVCCGRILSALYFFCIFGLRI